MNNIKDILETEGIHNATKFSIWFSLFKAINYVWVIIYPIFLVLDCLLILFGDFNSSKERNDFLSYAIEYFPPFIFSLLIVKRLNVKNIKTPTKIRSLLNIEFGVKFLVGMSLYILFEKGILSEKPESIFMGVIYYLIWATYFKKSKYVKAYYGTNAS